MLTVKDPADLKEQYENCMKKIRDFLNASKSFNQLREKYVRYVKESSFISDDLRRNLELKMDEIVHEDMHKMLMDRLQQLSP